MHDPLATLGPFQGAGGAETAGMAVQKGNLRALELKNTRFENVSCLFTGPGGLEMSVYTSGIICANLMARCTVIVDYARGRMAFVPIAEESTSDDSADGQ
jgi:hypothetical protein